ncbi:MAG TPA: hypothetical protein DET40_17440 [Lentisphaeria bacterium]|nr:MAG: hypothetical protein A2X45_02565 [Lentisphaerae bacterium GWF2_50_93]HCE45326.1 hypothetical protein [Lentisphaeria bacterium]
MNRKIYFLENFYGIQYFLSIYDRSDDNIIVTSGDPVLSKFLKIIDPDAEIHIIPRIPSYSCCLLPFLLVAWRFKYRKYFLQINPGTEIIYFNKGFSIQNFLMHRYLEKKSCKFIFIEVATCKFYEELIVDESIIRKSYLSLLSLCTGVEIARYKARLWPFHYGLVKYPEAKTICLQTWEHLENKFKLDIQKTDFNSILIIDGPITAIPGIDLEKTRQNLTNYFSGNGFDGIELHLKPHMYEGRHSFENTSLISKIIILPNYIPAEFFINKYKKACFFSSAACCTDGKIKLISLSGLLVFNDKTKEDNYWNLYKDYFHDKHIELAGLSK